ncbi:hypothetical protein SSX86_001701 [Deinandra increscens subsp. villosa]|uniref:Uncharacterized protein n=1 Tax=Deinandra increscens subsp. villosa TaxID=3103831 RepID=A0AAP0HCV0_9ASTR
MSRRIIMKLELRMPFSISDPVSTLLRSILYFHPAIFFPVFGEDAGVMLAELNFGLDEKVQPILIPLYFRRCNPCYEELRIKPSLIRISGSQPACMGSYPFSLYAMPSPNGLVEASLNTAGETEGDHKSPDGKEELSIKRCEAIIIKTNHEMAVSIWLAACWNLTGWLQGVLRWQDGAIVANNPTIFAIREAQLLWLDAEIDTLVSVGCCSVPAKACKGGWRYLDTGQVLIESACSVKQVEEALSTLLPMIPEINYF